MPRVGLEPTRIAPADFKSAASAYSATPASRLFYGGSGTGVKVAAASDEDAGKALIVLFYGIHSPFWERDLVS